MRHKYPWIDKDKCLKSRECPASDHCETGAFQQRKKENGATETGSDPEEDYDVPFVDLEKCKQCGTCSFYCEGEAVKMI